MLKLKAAFVALIISVVSISSSQSASSPKQMTIVTKDGKKIEAAFYFTPSTKSPCVVVLPDTRCDKNPYERFASKLNESGFRVLAMDFRFKDLISRTRSREEAIRLIQKQDLQLIVEDDLRSALEILVKEEAVEPSRIALVGSSLGSRIALVAATRYEVAALALVSLSGEYALPGDKKIKDLLNLYGSKPLLLMTSERDWGGNFKAAEHNRLYFEWAKGNKELKIWPGSGHGLEILNKDHAADFISRWLSNNLPGLQ